MKWKNVVAVVTGGTRGIGKALVSQLLAEGASVIATGQTMESICQAKKELPDARWLTLDQSKSDEIQKFVDIVKNFRVNLLINNAGVQQLRDFTNGDQQLYFSTQKEVSINVVGPVELTAKLLPFLKNELNAKVVIVTSGLALAPKQSSPIYCATKAALRSFVKSLRAQMVGNQWPISVIEVLPPLVDTDMTKGRGKKKMTAHEAARQILSGIDSDKQEVYVGASKLLKFIMRISPKLGESIMIKM